ncbi:zinc finger protein 839 isoform X2 [Pseudophryne corroboree]|uniref:zinc finger protein 839 isoform X2 n=1 Tax=Pseudophryne corroboree TaxID=495146 RepID=UPI003081566D
MTERAVRRAVPARLPYSADSALYLPAPPRGRGCQWRRQYGVGTLHKMAAVSGAGGPLEAEYVQVVVGEDEDEDGDPGGRVVLVQEGAAITSDLLHDIVHTDTVFYVQPDGSLVPGGSLAEESARNRVSLLPEETADRPPAPASQQLRTVAHHVALTQGDSGSVTRILRQEQLKSICVQVPGLPPEGSTARGMLEDNGADTSDHAYVSSAYPSAEIVHTGPQTEQALQPPLSTPSSESPFQDLVHQAPQPPLSTPSSESPFQVLVHQAQLASEKATAHDANSNTGPFEPLDEQRTCAAHPQNGTVCAAEKTQKKGQKRRKSIKVKTRSGRISRPPKHKAKDYKFLKVGDLIQGSSSDSEDYSELSTEEEDGGGGGKTAPAPCNLQPHTVKNTLFQCETCEKSYMGKGGLSRHYRLYPSHGQMEPPTLSDVRKNGDSAAGPSPPAEKKKPIPRPRKRLLEDPLNPSVTSPPTLAQDGFEFVPMSSARQGRRQVSDKRFRRPRKILAAAPAEQNAPTIREMMEQCDDADLKEQVAPSFAKLLSVYDFLLIKVKQDNSDKLLFPLVYKEFEKLHSMVKVLAEEYVSKMVLGSGKETVEVTDNKCSDKELMPPSKRFKPADPECGNPTGTSEKTLIIRDAGQRDEGDNQEGSSPGNYSCSNGASEGPELVSGSAQPGLMDEDAASPQTRSPPIPCATTEGLLETSQSPTNTRTEEPCDFSQNTSCELTQGNVTQTTHRDGMDGTAVPEVTPVALSMEPSILGPLSESSASSTNCPQMTEPTTIFNTAGTKAPSEETNSRASPGPPAAEGDSLTPSPGAPFCAGTTGADPCTTDFGLSHEHELVFIDSAEETVTEEAVVIFDNTESTSTNLDTVVALVEM